MKHYALIGHPVAHSLSATLFDDYCREHGITGSRYLLCDMQEELLRPAALRQWVTDNEIYGFNVTVPYKRTIIASLDHLTPAAETVGAVNCVAVSRQGGRVVLTGHNTDAAAFEQTLRPLLLPHHRAAIILGTGGAAHAVAYALRTFGIDYRYVSRRPELSPLAGSVIGYGEAAEQCGYRLLIVNATPVGMAPAVEATPWPYAYLLDERHLCYDLIYAPAESRFLCEARQRGAATCNGLAMLRRQALLSYTLWDVK